MHIVSLVLMVWMDLKQYNSMDKKGLCKLGRAIDHLSPVKPSRTALVTFVPYGTMNMIIQAFLDPFSFQFKILIKQRYICPQVTHFGNTRQSLQG